MPLFHEHRTGRSKNPLLSRKFHWSPPRPAFLAASYTSSVIEVRRQNHSAGNQKHEIMPIMNVPCTLSRTALLDYSPSYSTISAGGIEGELLVSQNSNPKATLVESLFSSASKNLSGSAWVLDEAIYDRTGGRARADGLNTGVRYWSCRCYVRL